jgi:hypothetical protein
METPDAMEIELRTLSVALTAPLPVECLLCYVRRMLDGFGCNATVRWARRWRDLRAPRATALEHRLARDGGFCDCEIFLNGWVLARRLRQDDTGHLEDGHLEDRNLEDRHLEEGDLGDGHLENGHLEDGLATRAGEPSCLGVRRGSSQPCALWVRRPQPWRR